MEAVDGAQDVWLVARPVKSFANLLHLPHHVFGRAAKWGGMIGKIGRAAETAQVGLLFAVCHVAIVIGDNWWHLKKLPDNTFALDITPFDPKTELLRIVVRKTDISSEAQFGLAVSILSAMRLEKTKADDIQVYSGGKLQDLRDVKRDYSVFQRLLPESAIESGTIKLEGEDKERKLKDTYGFGNTCHNFVINYLTELFCWDNKVDLSKPPTDAKEIDPDEKIWATLKEMYSMMNAKVDEMGSKSDLLDHYLHLEMEDK